MIAIIENDTLYGNLKAIIGYLELVQDRPHTVLCELDTAVRRVQRSEQWNFSTNNILKGVYADIIKVTSISHYGTMKAVRAVDTITGYIKLFLASGRAKNEAPTPRLTGDTGRGKRIGLEQLIKEYGRLNWHEAESCYLQLVQRAANNADGPSGRWAIGKMALPRLSELPERLAFLRDIVEQRHQHS